MSFKTIFKTIKEKKRGCLGVALHFDSWKTLRMVFYKEDPSCCGGNGRGQTKI